MNWSNPNCTGWRLPTEAEWEYAARGGESYKYAGSNAVAYVAWYSSNSSGQTHDVCGKNRNGYGLCDMSGNVSEWVWDWKGSYSSSPTVDPWGPISGSYLCFAVGLERRRSVRSSVESPQRRLQARAASRFSCRSTFQPKAEVGDGLQNGVVPIAPFESC